MGVWLMVRRSLRKVLSFALLGSFMLSGMHAQQNSGTSTEGPPQGEGPHGPPSPAQELQHLTHVLGLTTAQQAAVLPILQKRQEQMEALRQGGSSQSGGREQGRAIMEASRASIRALLTEAQQGIFDQMRRPGRGGGEPPSGPPSGSPGDGGPPPGSPQMK